jgi:hypothetical protein
MCSETLTFSAKSLLFRYRFLEEFSLASYEIVLYLCLVPFHILPSVGMTEQEPYQNMAISTIEISLSFRFL